MVVPRGRVLLADYPPGATFGPRTLVDFELVWLLSGSAEWVTRSIGAGGAVRSEETHRLRPGMMALARRGQEDTYRWDRERPSSHAYVHFTVTELGSLPAPEEWPAVRDLSEAPILEGLSDYLVRLAGLESEAAWHRSDEIVRLLLDLFVTGPLPPESQRWPPHIGGVLTYVDVAWVDGMRIVSAAELAEAARVSPGHLFRLFREAYGCGPIRALEIVRLARAAVSLQRSNASIAEVSGASGFVNPYHFSRRFSELYGVPPGAFRRSPQPPDPLGPVRHTPLLPVVHRLMNTGSRPRS